MQVWIFKSQPEVYQVRLNPLVHKYRKEGLKSCSHGFYIWMGGKRTSNTQEWQNQRC